MTGVGASGAAVPLPAGYYTDPTIFAAECELVFGRHWLPVAREDEIAAPGDFVTYRVVDEPVVVVRDRDGWLRGFANVCRHRNVVIAEGRGNLKALQCPYHLWTYGLDGRLVGAPNMGASVASSKDDLCLHAVAVECWQGWVFVNLDPEAAPMAPRVAGLTARCAPSGIAGYRTVERITYESPWNWKVQLENFAESYHHQGTHPATLQPAFPGERSWAEDNGGEPWFWLDHTSVVPGIEPFTASGAFPLLLFSLVRPHAALWFRMEVHAVDRLDLEIVVLCDPDAPEAAHGLADSVRAINAEDIEMNGRRQQGLRSRFATAGPMSDLEAAVGQFQRWLLGELAAGNRRSSHPG